ncbi:17466_t:CDS:2 [Dentiscutata heterogama]|uniref:17466_t:CDS:1 n=1 Tax=Dentiscutata heterogama TaxID=1316150 RepID=A0ACA9K798_9GLOM|nr:17466_t:CDS:2 [Dentiscutata heterogama]
MAFKSSPVRFQIKRIKTHGDIVFLRFSSVRCFYVFDKSDEKITDFWTTIAIEA